MVKATKFHILLNFGEFLPLSRKKEVKYFLPLNVQHIAIHGGKAGFLLYLIKIYLKNTDKISLQLKFKKVDEANIVKYW